MEPWAWPAFGLGIALLGLLVYLGSKPGGAGRWRM